MPRTGVFRPVLRRGSFGAVSGRQRGDFGRFRGVRGERGRAGKVSGGDLAVREGRGGVTGRFRAIFGGFSAISAYFRVYRAIFGRFRGRLGRFCSIRGECGPSPNIFGGNSVVFQRNRADFGRFGSFHDIFTYLPPFSRTGVQDYPPFRGTWVPLYPPSRGTGVSYTRVLDNARTPYPGSL